MEVVETYRLRIDRFPYSIYGAGKIPEDKVIPTTTESLGVVEQSKVRNMREKQNARAV